MKWLRVVLRPPIPQILGLLLITAVVLVGGREVQRRWWPALTDPVLIGIVVGIWVLALGIFVWRRMQGRRRARMIEDRLRGDAAKHISRMRPDRRGDIEALKSQLDDAIEALKAAKNGKKALVDLPWHMLIGPPGSGKSTMLRESGLRFPHLTHGRGTRGIGGTRNCDWWFTDQGILLDTAGRYTTEDTDQEEWLAFLDMIRRARPRKPINGAIVAISILDIVEADEEQVAAHAQRVCGRLLELTERLQVVFPVYLVFTKCDLLDGFVEMFGAYGKKEREQIWGFTLPYHQRGDAPLEEAVSERLGRLHARLQAERLRTLAASRSSAKKRKVFSFPLQFVSCFERVREFVALVAKPNPFYEISDVRGVYFTSGTQEGAPLDRVLASMSAAAGLEDAGVEADDSQVESKSYFIDRVFSDVIFPDADLARSSAAAERRRTLVRNATFAASIAVLVLLGALLTYSYARNSSLIDRAVEVAAVGAEFDPADPAALRREEDGEAGPLGRLGRMFAELDEAYLGLSTHVFGATNTLYEELVRPAYVGRLQKTFLEPIQDHLLAELEAAVERSRNGEPIDVRLTSDQLSAYSMLAGEVRLDRKELNEFLLERRLWTWGDPGVEPHPACRLHRENFIERVATPAFEDWQVRPSESIIVRARDVVEGNDVYGARLRDILSDSGKSEEVSIGELIDNPHSNLLEAGSGVTEAFARWVSLDDEFDARGERLPGGDGAIQLRKRRKEAAIEEWRNALADLRPRPRTRLDEALAILPELTGEQSPYIDAYVEVCSALSREELDVAAGDVEWLRKTLQEIAKLAEPVGEFCKRPHTDRVVRAATENGGQGIRQMVDAFGQARRAVQVNVENADEDVRDALEQSLIGLVKFFQYALAKEVYLEARGHWNRGIGGELRTMAQKLPFAERTDEFVAPPRFEEVFRADGVLDRTITWIQELERLPQVDLDDGFRESVRFAAKLRQTLFGADGRLAVPFQVVIQNQNNVVFDTRFQLGDRRWSTERPGTVREKIVWDPREGARIGVAARLFDGRIEPSIDTHADRPWGLVTLLGGATASEILLGPAKVPHLSFEWRFDHPITGDPLPAEVSAKIYVRTDSLLNPLEPGFFRHDFTDEVFRDPEY